eukprot:1158919-Pelagomonas_calceolata.AAC.8
MCISDTIEDASEGHGLAGQDAYQHDSQMLAWCSTLETMPEPYVHTCSAARNQTLDKPVQEWKRRQRQETLPHHRKLGSPLNRVKFEAYENGIKPPHSTHCILPDCVGVLFVGQQPQQSCSQAGSLETH